MAPKRKEQLDQIRQDQRQNIINVSFRLFAKEGFKKTNIGKIASEAGVSKGLIYHYFSSKEAILVAIFESLREATQEIVENKNEASPLEGLRQILEKTFKQIESSPEFMRFMIGLSIQPDAIETIKPYIDEENKRQLQIMEAIFHEMGYNEPSHEAFYLGAKLDGLVIGYITMGKDYPYEKMKQKIIEEYVSQNDQS